MGVLAAGAMLIAFAIAGVVIALESELLVMKQTEGRPHTIRLIVWMLLGVFGGMALTPRTGGPLDPCIYAVSGALIGLGVELFRRLLNRP